MVERFEELKVWQQAHELMLKIYDVSTTFPIEEKYNLTSQIRRATLSIPTNIAEGFGRYHYKENIKFLYGARGSLSEVKSLLHAAKDLNFIKKEFFNELYTRCENVGRPLNKYIETIWHKYQKSLNSMT